MATQSIFHNIVIQDPQAAESFVNALENAASISDKTVPQKVPSKDLKTEDIKKFFGVITND